MFVMVQQRKPIKLRIWPAPISWPIQELMGSFDAALSPTVHCLSAVLYMCLAGGKQGGVLHLRPALR